jgi:hypothetical protein
MTETPFNNDAAISSEELDSLTTEERAEAIALQQRLVCLAVEQNDARRRAMALESETTASADVSAKVRARLRDLAEEVARAAKVRADAKRTNDELLAAVEHAKASSDLRARGAAARVEAQNLEALLAKREAEDRETCAHLDRVIAEYKRISERRRTVQRRLTEELNALWEALTMNVSKSSAVPAQPDAREHLDVLAELAATREQSLHHMTRRLREVRAVTAIKAEETAAVDQEVARKLATRRAEQDEDIKRLVYRLQDDRKALQDDIMEMRRANAEQAVHLLRGHVQQPVKAKGDTTEVQLISSRLNTVARSRMSARATTFKPDPAPSEEEQHLIENNVEIEEKLRIAQQRLAVEQRRANDIGKNRTALDLQAKQAEAFSRQQMSGMDAQTQADNVKAERLEIENMKLTEDIKYFAKMLQTTKENIERVRMHSAPLPVE